MEHNLEEIRDKQKASWNKFSPGWKKWDALIMDFLQPMGDAMIHCIQPKDQAMILDIATGTGEPALTFAGLLKGGKVVMTDLSENMLEVAREKAAIRGIKNIETQVCDVCELPFADHTFDAISCRFGFMFFPNMLLAAKEIMRVLKPGGKMATAVWGLPEKNFWITAIGSTINKHLQLPTPPPEAPGMFRCANSGLLQDIFQQAGLKNIVEKEVTSQLKCGTADVYWNMMTDIAAPFVAALSKADDAMRIKIKEEVFQLVYQKYRDGNVVIDTSALVICGEK